MPPRNGLRLLAVPLLAALGAVLLWLPPQVVSLSGHAAVNHRAEAVVDDVTAQNLAAFATVSAIKTGLAIIEDSSVGVGFQLQLGDAVQAVYDYVDFIWEALLYALLILSAYKMLLETGLFELGLQVIGAGCLLWCAALLLPRLPLGVRRAGPRIVFAGLLFAYVVPVALLAMHYTTAHYTGPLRQKQADRITEIRTQLDTLTAQFGELKGSIDLLHPADTAAAVRKQFTDIATSITTTVNKGTEAMLSYVVIILFELLVFPMLTAYLLIKLLQQFFARAIERIAVSSPTPPADPTPSIFPPIPT